MSDFVRDIFVAASTGGLTFGTVAEPQRFSWLEVQEQAGGMSHRLAEMGIGRHDTVTVLAGRASDVAPLAQALWIRGAALTMLQQPTPRTDLAVWIADTVRAVKMLGASVVVVGEPFHMTTTALEAVGLTVCTVDSLRSGRPMVLEETNGADIAMKQLTSGSTGAPKAVEISHANLAANIEASRIAVDIEANRSVMASWLPLCHDMGMVGFICVPMKLGVETVVMGTEEFLRRPIMWAEMMSKFRATITAGPNFAYSVLARLLERADPDVIDLSSLRVAVNGAEPVDHRDLERFASVGARFGMDAGVPTPFYGLAESTLSTSAGALGEPAVVDRVSRQLLAEKNRAQTVDGDTEDVQHIVCLGLPVCGIEARITRDRTVQGPREVGAVELRGPSIAHRYITVSGSVELAGDDGWFDTGDLGYLDEHGRLYICGRSKDVIVLAGRNLYPQDIERAAAGVEGVREGCVVALRVDADREGFAVLAEVYDRYDEEARAQIRRNIAVRISSHVGHTPREVHLFGPGSLPKTTSGKLRRSSARALLGQ